MRPFKSAEGLSKWLLRLALVAIIYNTSFEAFVQFSFNSLAYFIHLLLVLFGVLIFIGAFASKHSLTVASALFITILFVILLYLDGFSPLTTVFRYLAYISISFYFLARGNK